MNNPYIKSSQHTRWSDQREAVAQPNGINYDQLSRLMEKQASPSSLENKKEDAINRKDLRKVSFIEDNNLKDDDSLKEIDNESIIPIPGMLIEHENSESDMKPPESNWIAPHGQQWGPMTL